MHRGPHVKNIVICCGGTGNEISENISNVLTLYRFLRKTDETEPHQIAFYDPGVGTLPPCRPHPPRERSRSSRTWDWTLIASGEPREGRADRTFRLLICPTRLGKNGGRFRELMYDSVYDESYVQDR
jgi:hypothetical protein